MDIAFPMMGLFRVKAVVPIRMTTPVVGNVARSTKNVSGVRTISGPRLLGGFLPRYERETEQHDVYHGKC